MRNVSPITGPLPDARRPALSACGIGRDCRLFRGLGVMARRFATLAGAGSAELGAVCGVVGLG